MGYNFEIQYQLGLENKVVDVLSRMPLVAHLAMLTAPHIIDIETFHLEVLHNPYLKKSSQNYNRTRRHIPNFLFSKEN